MSERDRDDLADEERVVVEQAREWVREHETELIDLLSGLVERPSVTGAEGTRDDPDTTVGYLWSTLENRTDLATLETQPIDDGDAGRENCYAVLEGASDDLFVCTSHTDTVAPGATTDWPADDPYRIADGTVRRVAPTTVELEIDGDVERRTIRETYDRTWERRGETERDALVGRGVYDNKASIACLVGAVLGLERGLAASGRTLDGTLVHGHLVGEEVSQVGAKAMVGWGDRRSWLDDRFPEASGSAVVMEGSYGLVPAVGHRGLAWATLRIDGESTHASTPHLGTNAVLETAKALAATDDPSFRERIAEGFRTDPLLGELTVAPGTTIVGGDVTRDRDGRIERTGVNAVPDWCETTFDVRFPRWASYPDDPAAIRESLAETIESHAAEHADETTVTAAIDPDEFFPPVALADSLDAARDHPLVADALDAARSTVGYDPGVTVAPGVTDAACLYPGSRLPTLVEYGPAGALSHEPLEFVERASVIETAEAMVEVTVRRLGVV